MLESLIVLSLYVAFLEAWLSPLKEKLQNSTNVDESVNIRRKMKWIRNISLVGFLLLYLVIGPIIVAQISNVTWAQYWLSGSTPAIGILVYNIWQAFRQKEEKNPLSPISTKRKDDVLKAKKPFILYLRGFENDNYSSKFKIESQGKFISFSEYSLVKEMKSRIPVYAVGMTKETYSPVGADRIYLDDSTWKDDVRELMIAADKIVILVDDKENCIWEIEQTYNLKEKTIFIVNDYYKYLMAKFKLENKYDLPRIEDKQYHSVPFYFSIENDHLEIHKISGYIELANFITQSLPNILSKLTIYALWIGSIISFFTIGAFMTAQVTTYIEDSTLHLIRKIYLTSIPTLYLVANSLMLKKKKPGFCLSIFASIMIVLFGLLSTSFGICIIGVFIIALTIIILSIKSNGRTGLNVLGIKKDIDS